MRHPHKKVIILAVGIVIFMFCFSFALSPLYNVFCKSTGFYAGIKQPIGNPDLNREITVQFVATNNQNLPWDFYPRTVSVTTHINENTRVVFFAKNKTDKTMTVQAIPSFTPFAAGKHFHKTECFCFSQQTLKAGESINMPVVFHVDEDLPNDVHTITLAYTLFDITSKLSQRTAP